MDSIKFSSIITTCTLCCSTQDSTIGFIDLETKQMPNSKKTVKSVLIHLNKCIQKDYNFDCFSSVCSSCFKKLVRYDNIMVGLLTLQKELAHMLEESMKIFNMQQIDEESIHENDDDEDYKVELVTEELDNEEIESIKYEVASASSSNSDEDESNGNNLIQESTKKIPIKCIICENVFKSKRALEIHSKVHSKSVSCSICGVAKRDEEYLELHMNTHEGKTENECRYCPKKYSRRSHVIRHMHSHWDKKKFQCEKCGLRFSQSYILYNHKLNHEAEEQPLICNVCHQTFKSRRTLNHHMITHQEDRPMYPCEICGKVFTQKYTIKAHLKTHTDGYESMPNSSKKNKTTKKDSTQIACIICDKVIGTKDSLDSHMAQEHDVITQLEENVYYTSS